MQFLVSNFLRYGKIAVLTKLQEECGRERNKASLGVPVLLVNGGGGTSKQPFRLI